MIIYRMFVILVILLLCLVSTEMVSLRNISKPALAGQGHEDCSMCHGVHSAKDLALFPETIKNDIQNPHTGEDMDKIDALCMMCHSDPTYGKGIRQIDPEKKHPFGIEPFLVKLPDQAKGFGGQKSLLSCMGCHDPHPSNENIGYLRSPTGTRILKDEDIFQHCLWCHPNMDKWLYATPPKPVKTVPKPAVKKKKPGLFRAPVLGGTDSGL